MSSKKQKNHQFWQKHYEGWKKSGQKQKDYCFIKGFSIHVFRKKIVDIRKLSIKEKKNRFLPVTLNKPISQLNSTQTAAQSSKLTLEFKEQFSIQIPVYFSSESLLQVIKVLEKV